MNGPGRRLNVPMRARVGLVIVAIAVFSVAMVLATNAARSVPTIATPSATPSLAPVPVSEAVTPPDKATFRLGGVVRDESGGGVAGALTCDHPAFGGAITCVRSRSDGAFELRAVAGLHKLEFVPPAGSPLIASWYPQADRPRLAQYLDVRAAERSDLVVRLETGRRVSGRTTDLSGAPVADAQACFSPTQTDIDWTCVRTDADGRYAATVASGDYLVFFVPPGGSRLITRWWRYAPDEISADVLRVRSDLEGIDATFPAGNLVVGKVVTSSGKPVEHALVCIDTRFPSGRICRPTNKQGEYTVAVRRGSFQIQFIASTSENVVNGWYGGGSDPLSAAQIAVNGDIRIDGSLRSGKLIWGSVIGGDGLPVQGAYVNAYDLAGNFVAGGAVGMSGDYGIVVPVGRYRVQAFPPIGSSYIAAYAGGGSGRIIEVRDRDTDVVFDVTLQRANVPAG
jgi:hypothetical protein